MFNTLFERRVCVQKNGDLIEWLTLRLENTLDEMVTVPARLEFTVTDSPSEVRFARGPCSATWRGDYLPGGMGAQFWAAPKEPIAGKQYATFGISLLRRGRASSQKTSLMLDDPVSVPEYAGLPVMKSEYRVYVMFPDHERGWRISGEGAEFNTSRMVTWSFGREASLRNIRAKAVPERSRRLALIEYDTRTVALCAAAGQLACGDEPQVDVAGDIANLLREGHNLDSAAIELGSLVHKQLGGREAFMRTLPAQPTREPRPPVVVNLSNSRVDSLAVGPGAHAISGRTKRKRLP